jgi:hypothetical protein
MELHIIHNDEVIEMGKQARGLEAVGVQQDVAGPSIDVAVALDAPLSVEDEIVIAVIFGKGLDSVRDHAVEPANTVFAGGADAGSIAEIEACSIGQGGGKFGLGRRKALWRERTRVGREIEAGRLRLQLAGERGWGRDDFRGKGCCFAHGG